MARPKNRLREIRTARGFSTAYLAERVGKPQSAISRIENGLQSLTLDLMHPLAHALGVRPSDLVDDGTPPSFGVVRGTLEDGGRLYDSSEGYAIAIPYPRSTDWRVKNTAELTAVFEQPSRRRQYLAEERFPDESDRDRPFIIAFDQVGRARLELRTYEIVGAVGGFSSKTGDPVARWIRVSETKISAIWSVIGEYRWLLPPQPIITS